MLALKIYVTWIDFFVTDIDSFRINNQALLIDFLSFFLRLPINILLSYYILLFLVKLQ